MDNIRIEISSDLWLDLIIKITSINNSREYLLVHRLQVEVSVSCNALHCLGPANQNWLCVCVRERVTEWESEIHLPLICVLHLQFICNIWARHVLGANFVPHLNDYSKTNSKPQEAIREVLKKKAFYFKKTHIENVCVLMNILKIRSGRVPVDLFYVIWWWSVD